MTSKAPLFATLDEPGVFDWGVGFAAALACHLAAPRSWETPFAAQLAAAWPELHAPHSAFHDPAVTRLRYLTAAQAAQATSRWILLQATQSAEPALSPDLDPTWRARLTDPTAQLAASLCQQAVDRLRELDRWTADDWTAATVAYCAREQDLNRVTAKPAIPLGELKYRLAALWTARLESALCSQERTTLPDPLVTNFQNLFLEYYLQLLNLHLQTPNDDLTTFLFEMQEKLNRTPIPRALQNQLAKPPRWRSSKLTQLQWLNHKGLAFIDAKPPLPPPTDEDEAYAGRATSKISSYQDTTTDLLFVARLLPGCHEQGWQLLLGDRLLQGTPWQTETIASNSQTFIPAQPCKSYFALLLLDWLADLFPTEQTSAFLKSWLETGDSCEKASSAIPLAAICPTENTRLFLESGLHKNRHSQEGLDDFASREWLRAIAFVWPDERTRSFLLSITEDLTVLPRLRETAVQLLALIWPTQDTRHFLATIASNLEIYENDDGGEPRSEAMIRLMERWPDLQTKALLENVIQNDTCRHTIFTALTLLKEKWPAPCQREAIECLLDGPESSNPYPVVDLLESLAAHWPDEQTKQRILRLLTPTSSSCTVKSLLKIIAKNWQDPASHEEITQIVIDWLSIEHHEISDLIVVGDDWLKNTMPTGIYRSLFERNLARNDYCLVKQFPDSRTRSLIEEDFIRVARRPHHEDLTKLHQEAKFVRPDSLASHYPDEATRQLLIHEGLASQTAANVYRTLATLASHWPDEEVRQKIENLILNPLSSDPNVIHTEPLIRAYKVFTNQPFAKKFLLRAIREVPNDRTRSAVLHMIESAFSGDLEWIHDCVLALARGELGELLSSRTQALIMLAQHWPDKVTRCLIEEYATQLDVIKPCYGREAHLKDGMIIVARDRLAEIWPDEQTFRLFQMLQERGSVLTQSVKYWLDIASQTKGLLPPSL